MNDENENQIEDHQDCCEAESPSIGQSLSSLESGPKPEREKVKSYLLDSYFVQQSFSFGYTVFFQHSLVSIERKDGMKKIFIGEHHQFHLDQETIEEHFLPHLKQD